MTLIDSRPGIVDTLAVLADESGEDALRAPDLLVALLKRNLDLELADRLPPDRAAALADRFRELYAGIGVLGSFLLPGALDAVVAVRAGRRAVVVTAKYRICARRCLDHVGLDVDAVHGWRLGRRRPATRAGAGHGLRRGHPRHGGRPARRGDRPRGATGPYSAEELRAPAPTWCASSLAEFPPW
jgi:phosphoglycolate phosphatase